MLDDRTRQIATRIRTARWLCGKSQEALARRLGISFQQVQKYETGANRVPSNRLCQIAGVLGVSPAWLLECGEDAPCDRETMEVAAAYARLPQPARAIIRSLIGQLDSTAKAANGEAADDFEFRDPIGW